jgi:hypothetical protein
MRYFISLFVSLFIGLWISVSASAQFLPDNKTLNAQSLERWMQSAAAMSPVVELIDSMHTTDEEIKQFDALPAAEQDQKIQQFLSQKQQADVANQIAKQYGWKSPGEFRRWSTRLGNAIAAYFSKKDMQGLTADQIKQLQAKMDAAILAVPESDIDFVQQHEKQLQRYIQSYGK